MEALITSHMGYWWTQSKRHGG